MPLCCSKILKCVHCLFKNNFRVFSVLELLGFVVNYKIFVVKCCYVQKGPFFCVITLQRRSLVIKTPGMKGFPRKITVNTVMVNSVTLVSKIPSELYNIGCKWQ